MTDDNGGLWLNLEGTGQQVRLVEFKDLLYSSPMATPRDTKRGEYVLNPWWNGY
jgi:hypothetical protein